MMLRLLISDAGNAQGKSGLLFRRSNVDLPAMSVSDFRMLRCRGPLTEAFDSIDRPRKELRLKKLSHNNRVDRLTLVCDHQLETPFVSRRQHADGLAGRAVSQRAGDKIRRDLSDTLRITIDRMV